MSEVPKRSKYRKTRDDEPPTEDLEATRTAVVAMPLGLQISEKRTPHLTAVAGPRAGETYALDRTETVLGRGRESHIVIDGDGVSRRHARINRMGDECVLEDLASRNGTFVQIEGQDDVRVRVRKLSDGERIQVGNTVILKYSLLDEREARLQRQLYESAVRDALTGAYNRQHFEERLRGELEHARSHGAPLAMIMCDIDHFKKINDTWGHPAGDAVLRAVVSGMKERVRPDNLLARIGGEEFVVLARGLDAAQALALAERLWLGVRAAAIRWKATSIPVTMSFGVALLEECAGTAEALVALADERLYAAKNGGRDRIVGSR